MYGKEISLYCIQTTSTMNLETSNYNIVKTTYLDLAAHLQKDLPSSNVMHEWVLNIFNTNYLLSLCVLTIASDFNSLLLWIDLQKRFMIVVVSLANLLIFTCCPRITGGTLHYTLCEHVH